MEDGHIKDRNKAQKRRGPLLKNGSKATLILVCEARSEVALSTQIGLAMGELVESFWWLKEGKNEESDKKLRSLGKAEGQLSRLARRLPRVQSETLRRASNPDKPDKGYASGISMMSERRPIWITEKLKKVEDHYSKDRGQLLREANLHLIWAETAVI